MKPQNLLDAMIELQHLPIPDRARAGARLATMAMHGTLPFPGSRAPSNWFNQSLRGGQNPAMLDMHGHGEPSARGMGRRQTPRDAGHSPASARQIADRTEKAPATFNVPPPGACVLAGGVRSTKELTTLKDLLFPAARGDR